MKNLTEQQYAELLVDKYYNEIGVITEYESIQCAKIDVHNTIDALNELTSRHYTDELLTNSLQYYTKVLTILNDMK